MTTTPADLFHEADVIHPDADRITPNSDPTCQVCDTPLSWSGKGFRPKYCDDHRPHRSDKPRAERSQAASPAGAAAPAGKSRNNAAVNRAIETIEMMYGLGGTALNATVAPTLGSTLVAQRKELSESYRLLLETNATVRKWFTEVEGKAAWLPILVVHGDLAVNAMLRAKVAKMARTAQGPAEQSSPNPEPANFDPEPFPFPANNGIPDWAGNTPPPHRPDGA